MALVAYIATVPAISPDYQLVVTIHYFDDNDPLNTGIDPDTPPPVVVKTESWPFPATLTGEPLQQAIKAEIERRGTDVARARTAQANAAFYLPVGALVAIPGT